MLRQLLQRLVRRMPRVASTMWTVVPPALRRRLSPLVYPIAAGVRGGGSVLPVPALPARSIFAVRLSEDDAEAPLAGVAGVSRVSLRPDSLEAQARAAEILDAVVWLPESFARMVSDRCARLGWRLAKRSPAAPREVLRDAYPNVTVILISFENAELLRHCLAGLRRNTPWPALEVIVVDNASTDDAPAVIRDAEEAGGVRGIFNDANLGFARAVNQGLAAARGRFVVLLNDDTVVGPGWLSRLVTHLELQPGLGLVGPVTNEIGNDAKIDVSYATFDEMEALGVQRAFDCAGRLVDTSSLALFCAAARRDVLEEVGGLDERYELGMFEDDDLCRALRQRGYRLGIATDAFVHHVGQASFSKLSDVRYLEIWEGNKRRFEEKWREPWRPPRPAGGDR